jgi:hypothetical protein
MRRITFFKNAVASMKFRVKDSPYFFGRIRDKNTAGIIEALRPNAPAWAKLSLKRDCPEVFSQLEYSDWIIRHFRQDAIKKPAVFFIAGWIDARIF